MAFKSINHDDEKIFYNRLWKLMEDRNLSTARELAQALYAEEIVPVDSASEDEISIIGSMTRRIQEHLNLEGTDKLQGRYVKAYCDFFGCSADYLFGLSSIKSENPDVIRFCEATGLSEKSVRRLIEDLPEDIKRDLVGFWSNVLETSVYKGYKQDKIEMRGDRAEMSDFPLYLNTVAGGLDCRDQTIGGFSFVVKIYAVPVIEIIG